MPVIAIPERDSNRVSLISGIIVDVVAVVVATAVVELVRGVQVLGLENEFRLSGQRPVRTPERERGRLDRLLKSFSKWRTSDISSSGRALNCDSKGLGFKSSWLQPGPFNLIN